VSAHDAPAQRGPEPAIVVVLAGVCAALHVGKLPPAIGALQHALGVTLLEAGFLLSLTQFAGMAAGLAFGALADRIGLRRSMASGLVVLGLASAAGGAASAVAALMLLRAVEGFGFLLAVLPAPGLVRRLAPAGRVNAMLGLWGAYMPLGAALALLAGPPWIARFGWRSWWWALGAAALAMAAWLVRAVPAQDAAPGGPAPLRARLTRTLASGGPWLVAVSFAMYSGQWLAVIGFLPAIYQAAGLSGALTGVLTAIAAAVNIAGNVGAGRLLQRGVPAPGLLVIGFAVMGVAAVATFAGAGDSGLPAPLRYAAVLAFSATGGMIPATLFALAVRLAPGEATLSTTVGWVQQWSSLGQFAGPPLVAWVAGRSGGWQSTWLVTGACSAVGLLLAWRIAVRLRR
jgi:MFS family permease